MFVHERHCNFAFLYLILFRTMMASHKLGLRMNYEVFSLLRSREYLEERVEKLYKLFLKWLVQMPQ